MTLKEVINDRKTKFVDVRTIMEYNEGHIDGAVNIPLDQFQRRYQEIDELGKVPVVLYCRSGNRSAQAAAFLQQKGFKNIYNGGGLDDIRFYLN